jgi:mercuric ion binding protein
MNRASRIWLSVLLSSGLLHGAPALAAEVTVRFTVDNMTCATCPLSVRTAMGRVAGVESVVVDFDAAAAVVVYDDSVTTAEQVAQASTDIGFPARIQSAP